MTKPYKQNEMVWLSVLQGFAMLLVVIGHVIHGGEGNFAWQSIVNKIIYSFHMPLFMCISGYLFHKTQVSKNKPFDLMLKNKAIRLLVPYFSLTLFCLVLKIAFSEYMRRKSEFSINQLLDAFVWMTNNPLGEMWFINALFGLMLLYPVYLFANKNNGFAFLLFVCFFVLHFIETSIPSFVLNFGKIISYAVFFYGGILLSQFGFGKNFKYGTALFSSFRNYTYQVFLLGIFPQVAVRIAFQKMFTKELGVGEIVLLYVSSIGLGLYIPVLISKIAQKLDLKVFKLCIGLR